MMLLFHLMDFVFGYHVIECEAKNAEKLLNIFMRYRMIYRDFRKCGDKVFFSILSKDEKSFRTLCQREGIVILSAHSKGLFHIIKKYKRRAGLLLGLAFIAFFIWFSGLFVWRIYVVGNTSVSSGYVVELLGANGLDVGSYIPSLELDKIRESTLIASDKLSWMALNVKGTSIEVVVREIEEGKQRDNTPRNLVAECDGVIELLEVHKGKATVNVGDAVRAGELLVSGIVSDEKTSAKYVHAEAKVFARTNKRIHIEIPLEYEAKSYTGEIKREKRLKFFDKSINLFVNSGNLYENYDKIEREECLTFFGRFSVPVSILTSEFSEYTYSTKTRTETEAVKLAFAELSLKTEEVLADAELVKRSVAAHFEDEAFIIDCDMVLTQNIVKEAKFETE